MRIPGFATALLLTLIAASSPFAMSDEPSPIGLVGTITKVNDPNARCAAGPTGYIFQGRMSTTEIPVVACVDFAADAKGYCGLDKPAKGEKELIAKLRRRGEGNATAKATGLAFRVAHPLRELYVEVAQTTLEQIAGEITIQLVGPFECGN